MPKTLNISAARKELPSLFDRVTSKSGEMVVICRRDGQQKAALVSLDYLQSLELANRRFASIQGFRLMGSGEAVSDVEKALAAIRAEDAEEAHRRVKAADNP